METKNANHRISVQYKGYHENPQTSALFDLAKNGNPQDLEELIDSLDSTHKNEILAQVLLFAVKNCG